MPRTYPVSICTARTIAVGHRLVVGGLCVQSRDQSHRVIHLGVLDQAAQKAGCDMAAAEKLPLELDRSSI
jgi:hypothetical protein